jgi:transposase
VIRECLSTADLATALGSASTEAVADRFGVSRQTIHRWCEKLGIVNPNKRGVRPGTKFIRETDLRTMITQLTAVGFSVTDIARTIDRSRGHVQYVQRKMRREARQKENVV